MTQVQIVHRTAQHMRQLARDAALPGYAQKLDRAADDLEKLEGELKAQTGPHALRPSK